MTHVDAEADLSITKSDSPDPVLAGNQLTYTLTVHNEIGRASCRERVNDTVATQLTEANNTVNGTTSGALNDPALMGTLAAAGTGTIVITATVKADTADDIFLSNTAAISSGHANAVETCDLPI